MSEEGCGRGNAVCWFEIYVNDMKRARSFYESVFQAKLEGLGDPGDAEIEMWSFPGKMTSYGANGALVKMQGVSAGGCGTIVYFSCEDCGVEEKRVTQFGGSVHKSKFSIGPYGFISLVTDSEGNTIGLHSIK